MWFCKVCEQLAESVIACRHCNTSTAPVWVHLTINDLVPDLVTPIGQQTEPSFGEPTHPGVGAPNEGPAPEVAGPSLQHKER